MVKPWDLLDSNVPRASEELQSERMETCLGCENLLKLTKQCNKCGCFMELKTRLLDAKCPIGKW
jgi:hypothetical protein